MIIRVEVYEYYEGSSYWFIDSSEVEMFRTYPEIFRMVKCESTFKIATYHEKETRNLRDKFWRGL